MDGAWAPKSLVSYNTKCRHKIEDLDLKMEAAWSPEKVVPHHSTTWRLKREDFDLKTEAAWSLEPLVSNHNTQDLDLSPTHIS
jgi:hypothetical protein